MQYTSILVDLLLVYDTDVRSRDLVELLLWLSSHFARINQPKLIPFLKIRLPLKGGNFDRHPCAPFSG